MVVKLFYAPGACSLASHICLIEGKAQFEAERVDLKTKITASGGDFRAVTAKGYVPALMLGSGEVVTENVAVLSYLAGELPALGLSGERPWRISRRKSTRASNLCSRAQIRKNNPELAPLSLIASGI
ncbi:hypothetical protein [Rhizobium sp. Leaf453]|uniref:hypothetical protein n=1 Tax=Rhizobium sp. Leaf453 TaxID=1736380 RepID=UPI000AC3C60A|nr:hypothetical protein [Rhizobium sp. Leaf453]